MWLFTKFGFFSVVRKKGEAQLTVRARVAADLDRLRSTYLPALSPTVAGAGTDYPYRAQTSSAALGEALQRLVADLDYGNFKSEVAKELGEKRAHVYAQVWQDLLKLESGAPAPVPRPTASRKPRAYGGIVFDETGKVLLFEPRDHFGGYVWTFPKGRPEAMETPEQTACREVLEETGMTAQIVAPVPGEFAGETSVTSYFVMRLVSRGRARSEETQATVWATPEEAVGRIRETLNPKGRARDLAVLAAGCAVARAHHLL